MDLVRFDRAVQQNMRAITDGLQKCQMAVSGLADFFEARNSITQPEWQFRIRMLTSEQKHPGLLEAGFAELDFPATTPAGANPSPAFTPAAPLTSGRFAVKYAWVRPPSAMSGVDPGFLLDSEQARAAWQAIHSGSTTISGLRQLSAELDGHPARGITLFSPVSHPIGGPPPVGTSGGAEPEGSQVTNRPARGVSFCALEPNILLDQLFGVAPREVAFELFDQPIASPTNWLNPSTRAPLTLDRNFRAYLKTNFTFQVLDRTWSISFFATPVFEREASLSRPWIVLPLGLGLTLAVTCMLVVQIHSRLRQDVVAADLKSACHELQRVQSERERVSRELHDGAIQSLYLMQLTLGRAERLLHSNLAEVRELLTRCGFSLDGVIADLRRFLLKDDSLQPPQVTFPQAHALLSQLVQRFRNTESIQIEMHGECSSPFLLTASQMDHLKQIAQEAMSNSLRHSRAKQMSVELRASDGFLQLVVADNGQGFDPYSAVQTGNGLANMQARAIHLGGTLQVEARVGHGTRIALRFPVSPGPTPS
jgi:signal transduction histidine kinase